MGKGEGACRWKGSDSADKEMQLQGLGVRSPLGASPGQWHAERGADGVTVLGACNQGIGPELRVHWNAKLLVPGILGPLHMDSQEGTRISHRPEAK